MIKVSDWIEGYLKQEPVYAELLNEGLLNISALARKIQPMIEQELKKEIAESTLIMAIRRTPIPGFNFMNTIKKNKYYITEIGFRSELNVYSFVKSTDIAKKQQKLMASIENDATAFYSFSQGSFERTLIINSKYAESVDEIFETEKLIESKFKLSAVLIQFESQNIKALGLYGMILQQLAFEGVNLYEVISTANEFILIVEDEHIEKCLSSLMKMKKGA